MSKMRLIYKPRVGKNKWIQMTLSHRLHVQTKQLLPPKIPVNVFKTKQELKSKFSDILFPEPTARFQILCWATGLTISVSCMYLLREKLGYGTIAGVTAKTVTAPLDRVVVFRQASVDFKSSIGPIFKCIVNEEGIKGLWRGNWFVLCR